MEDGLGEVIISVMRDAIKVLILVLVEDGLGVPMFLVMYNVGKS